MVQKTYPKIVALLISIVVLILSFYNNDWHAVGIYPHCSTLNRCCFSFFHASLLHALINIHALLSLVFIYQVSCLRIVIAFIIAIITPSCILPHTPTVGLSAVCFFILGSVSFSVRRKLYFHIYSLSFIALGLLLPAVNVAIHLYSYSTGVLFSLFNTPLVCLKK